MGPVTPKRLAPLHYATSFDSLSSTRACAATFLLTHVPDPLLRAPRGNDGMDLHAPASKPPPPQPSADEQTRIANLRGDTQMPSMPLSVTSEFGSPNELKGTETMSTGVGVVGPADSSPIERMRAPEGSRKGYH